GTPLIDGRFARMPPVTLTCDEPQPPHLPVLRKVWSVDLLAALTLLAAAAALRAGPLAPPSLWIDDAWVSLLSKVHTISDARRISVAAPGFIALRKAWFWLVRFSNLRPQAPAFVFGILGPPALFVTARSWRLQRAAALLA